jgi:hypothetical protein
VDSPSPQIVIDGSLPGCSHSETPGSGTAQCVACEYAGCICVVVAAAAIAAVVITITKTRLVCFVVRIMHRIMMIVFIYIQTIACQNILYSLTPVNYHTTYLLTTSNAIL